MKSLAAALEIWAPLGALRVAQGDISKQEQEQPQEQVQKNKDKYKCKVNDPTLAKDGLGWGTLQWILPLRCVLPRQVILPSLIKSCYVLRRGSGR
jgi:hypothetical protein